VTLSRRLLWHALRVEGDPRAVGHLAALLPDAAHPFAPLRTLDYSIRPSGDELVVTEEGDLLATVVDPQAAADLVHVRAHRRAFELASRAGWVRVHAATVDLDGVRVLVVGPSGTGKSTLATRLLLDGADVQGDESVLVRRDASLAVPRALHLKPGAERVLPELASVLPTLPAVGDVTVLDPARLGRPTTLRPAPVGHVVLLAGLARPGPVTCTPVDGGVVLEALLTDAFPLTETNARMVSVLAGAMLRARGHRLSSGPPAAMVDALRSAIR
jgi:HPr kinase/phosphorylase